MDALIDIGLENIFKTTTHPWCDGHSKSISVCGMGGQGLGFKSLGENLTHIYT